MSEETRNKIILIGNGFDLAHGMETSYNHFVEWLKTYKIARSADDYFENITLRNGVECYNDSEVRSARVFFDYYWQRCDHLDYFISERGKDRFRYKHPFFSCLLQKPGSPNWVDIEEEYYIALNQLIDEKNEKAVEKLNGALLVIRNALEEYLRLQTKDDAHPLPMISENIKSIIESENAGDILFLSFNYTDTEKKYIPSNHPNGVNSIDVIHIHGDLKNTDNPIIFGYGDEIGDKAKLIENENKNAYLENIKSVKYLDTNNYKRLLSVVDASHYDVFVMGHSCGISDRTLLNTLFEHEHCLSVKVFYHKIDDRTDNFSDVVRNIYRNFNDKRRMREIVADRTMCRPLS